MKKWLLCFIILVLFVFIGCGEEEISINFNDSDNFKTLNKVLYPNNEYISYSNLSDTDEIYYGHFNYLNDFMNVTSKKLLNNFNNNIYSPISLFMALCMLTEGATLETKDELLSLLSSNEKQIEDLRIDMNLVYNHNYYSNKHGLSKISNSIWIRKDKSINNNYLSVLESSYNANAYETIFDDEGKSNIVDWINGNTNNLLKLEKENFNIDPNTALMLINTVYFDNKWENEFDKLDNFSDIFYGFNANGIENHKNVEYMNHVFDSIYYETDNCEIFIDYFKNENMIKIIFPKENSSIYECLNSDILTTDIVKKGNPVELDLSIPKFKTNSSFILNDTLVELGVSKIFSSEAELDNIANGLYVSCVKQDAGIILNEEGVKAAASTNIFVNESCGPTIQRKVTLNRPFIYIIYDSHNVPLFIGTVNDPIY